MDGLRTGHPCLAVSALYASPAVWQVRSFSPLVSCLAEGDEVFALLSVEAASGRLRVRVQGGGVPLVVDLANMKRPALGGPGMALKEAPGRSSKPRRQMENDGHLSTLEVILAWYSRSSRCRAGLLRPTSLEVLCGFCSESEQMQENIPRKFKEGPKRSPATTCYNYLIQKAVIKSSLGSMRR